MEISFEIYKWKEKVHILQKVKDYQLNHQMIIHIIQDLSIINDWFKNLNVHILGLDELCLNGDVNQLIFWSLFFQIYIYISKGKITAKDCVRDLLEFYFF